MPEFEHNISQMDSDEALRFLDAVRAQVAKGKLSPKKLADLLGEYASEPRIPASLNMPDSVMQALASKMNSADLANLMLTSKEIKRQTEPVSRANAAASPLLYLPPKLLDKVLAKLPLSDISELKSASRFASQQVDNALFKRNPIMLSDIARKILTLANWVQRNKEEEGGARISLTGTRQILFPTPNRDSIRLETGTNEYSYIDLPAKIDDATIRKLAVYISATENEPGGGGFTTFYFININNEEGMYRWRFGTPFKIPAEYPRHRRNKNYVKHITAYAKAVQRYFYPEAPIIRSPTSSPAS
jgi:hypothetical protein